MCLKNHNSFINPVITETEDAIEHSNVPVQDAYRGLAHKRIKQYERGCIDQFCEQISRKCMCVCFCVCMYIRTHTYVKR
jgi:hypothetical protein